METATTHHPNIFRFATGELSQDAVICWLLSWADDKVAVAGSPLHAFGREFLGYLLRSGGRQPLEHYNVTVKKQDGFIDVLCLINDRLALIIEDKRGSTEHSDQLRRYLAYALEKYPEHTLVPIYLQSGIQSDYGEVETAGFNAVTRRELLALFETETAKRASEASDILRDYVDHLRDRNAAVQRFAEAAPDEWDWDAWSGFFSAVQSDLKDGSWKYVANPAGGVMIFHWKTHVVDESEQYLQLEEQKLCFKIWVSDAQQRRDMRQLWHERLLAAAQRVEVGPIRKPDRFGMGEWMTVAVWDGDYRVADGQGRLDFKATMKKIRSAEIILAEAAVNG
jgi:hypothetical protein